MKRSRNVLLFLLIALLVLPMGCRKTAASDPAPAPTPEPAPTEVPAETGISGEYVVSDPLLLAADARDNNRVFYEIFVGSFSDSNGDGIGDLRGIINRMDYLNDGDPNSGKSLGVEGLWLTPIFTSRSYHKYDVADYYEIDPQFGTLDDFLELLELCHQRDVLVILDLPINHTSTRCEWFKSFRDAHQQGDTASAYYDFYTWYDGTQGSAPAGRTFSPVIGTEHYYECNFASDMPELNFDNEQVREAVLDVAKYWLNVGVDGFRFDAAKYIYYGNHATSLDFWLWYLGTLRQEKPDLYTIAEVWDGDGITDLYYPATNCFDFQISQSSGLIAETANKGDVNRYTAYVEGYLNRVQALREDATIAPFITNHDMDRAAGFLTLASNTMRTAANLYLLGPGTPFIYYGEEIGLRGSRGGANTDANRRLAMPWGDGDTVADPTGTTYDSSKKVDFDALTQVADANSLYTYYKKLLMIRKANPAIARGEYKALAFADTKVGGFAATLDGETVLVIHNTTMSSKTVDLSAFGYTLGDVRAVIGVEDAALDGASLRLGGQTSIVIACK